MRILSLELKNIRSYKQEKTTFPKGLVLLSGDIGSGKSTLLLAIEFALFGLQRGQLSGSELLRHGAQEGRVRLTCEIDNEEITITRVLKRTATSVSQGPGTIVIGGTKQDMTAVELKAKMLELLAYPESLLTQKSLVFRYTIYTPQEHMKQILFEKPEERLDTFRKLFGIDKYKRIRENATLLARELRVSIERLRGQADDIVEREKELANYKKEQLEGSSRLLELQKTADVAKKKREEQREALEKIEKVARERKEQQKEHLNLKERLAQEQRRQDRLSREQKSIEEELEKLPKEAPNTSKIREAITNSEKELAELQEHITQNSRNEAKAQALIDQLKKSTASVEELEDCPTCKQKVPHEHKQSVQQQAEEKTLRIKERQEQIREKQQELEERAQKKRDEQSQLRKQAEEQLREKSRYDFRKQYLKQLEDKKKEFEETKEQIFALTRKEEELKEKLTEPFDEEKLRKLREETRRLEGEYQQAITNLSRAEERLKGLEERVVSLEKTIIQKEAAVKKARRLEARREWLTKEFTNLMSTIERQVLMALYHQFNDSFKEWFDELIEDETMTVRLDHDFGPLIEQNGYETQVDNLSGGEKTAVALAYRLALNKIINQSLDQLKTDGLLILDEPTDGFSSEQLDRVQEVLSNLGLEQILVVSHEAKMESFVDHVIRVVKNEHESHIL